MDRLYQANFSADAILKINRCRMYLKVLTLADISLGDGGFIDPEMYHGRKSPYKDNTHQWPRQEKPPRSAWTQWQLAVDTVWSQHQSITPSLGPWITKPIMKWKWFHDITTSSLYEIKSDTTIHKYDALDHLQRRNRHYFTPFGEPTPAIPLTAAPVIPHTANHALCCTT